MSAIGFSVQNNSSIYKEESSLGDFCKKLEKMSPYERTDCIINAIQNLLEQNQVEENQLEKAVKIGRMATGLSQGYVLESVARKYIELGNLERAMEIAQTFPSPGGRSNIYAENIERAVARAYVERGDLDSARKIAQNSSSLSVKTNIEELCIEKEFGIGKGEMGFLELLMLARFHKA